MNNNIAEIRNTKNMSQSQLSMEVGISRPHLSNIENCKKEPSCSIAIRIANVFNKKVEDIFLLEV